ncbi:ras-related protein Rab-44 isoform X2 [Chrysoperla carnea]|uniref:ras-related protein Rab-44 isoform X2 n=1 Tax=Chrysoperla carnea TaxID=189513 RepID=UPI001D08A383|nr:ras-related protein Rab-44 isoform X2 [Chrysoperla carnea]
MDDKVKDSDNGVVHERNKDETQAATESDSRPSGPYPINVVKPSMSPKLSSKINSAKGRLSALRSSLRRDVEGIKSSIRRSDKKLKIKSKSSENIRPEDVPLPSDNAPSIMPRKNKSKAKKSSTAVPKTEEQQNNDTISIADSELSSDKQSSTSSATPTSVKRHAATTTAEGSISENSLTTTMDIEKPSSDVDLPPSHAPPPVPPSSTTAIEDYLNTLTEAQNISPIQIAIVSPSTTIKEPLSPSKDELIEQEKTESCDEDAGDETEDRLGGSSTSEGMGTPAYGDVISNNSNENRSSSMIEAGTERREHLYKILVIGELGTGKTSIIKRYVHQFFSQHYRATIGVDFALKVLNWDANTIIRLQLWDIAGQERFGNMTRVYYKEAVGAFIVFDVTRVATFDAVVKWKQDLDSKVQLADGSPIPCILLANKCDQQKEGLVNTPAKMDEYCKEKGFAGWYETSAKENINIEEAARSLVNKILLNDKLLHGNDSKKDNEIFALDGKNGTNSGSEKSVSSGGKSCAC